MYQSKAQIHRCGTTALFAFAILLGANATAHGQQPNRLAGDGLPALPSEADHWINSRPLDYELLAGKGVVFWFFEEDCPRTAKAWSELKRLAADNFDKPILFVAVNSGTDREELEKYLRKNEVDWPTIADTNRQFEKAGQVPTISLRNTKQAYMLTPDGRFRLGQWKDLEWTVQQALTGAKWTINPDDYSPELFAAIRAIEFDDYQTAASEIRTVFKDPSDEVKQSVRKLVGVIRSRIQEAWQAVAAQVDADKTWEAYQAYRKVADRFAGIPLPKQAQEMLDQLASSPAVKREHAAMKRVKAAERLLRAADKPVRERAVDLLKTVVRDYEGTQAASRAAELLGDTE
jgi:thiol-disulfide isomerase/thioredoxin